MRNISTPKMRRVKFEAFFGLKNDLITYLTTYHNAFNALIEHIDHSGLHVDTISYPIFFIARHCLELGCKENIKYFSKYSNKNNFTKTDSHKLSDLFAGFKFHIDIFLKKLDKYNIQTYDQDIKEFKSLCDRAHNLINIFTKIDNNSQSFRYNTSTENEIFFKSPISINVLDIQEMFESSMKLFYYTKAVFYDYACLINEIEVVEEETYCI